MFLTMGVWGIVFLCIMPVYLCVHVWLSRRRTRSLCAGLPGWPELPFLGNMMQFYGGTAVVFRRVNELSEISERTNSIFQAWLGSYVCLVISKPEDAKAVTNAFLEKPFYYKFGKCYLGNGLVTAPASLWKKNIKNLAASFSPSVVDGFQHIFNAQALRMVERLSTEIGKPPFEAINYLAYTTLETVCQTALGITDMSQNLVTPEYYHAFNRALELFTNRGFNIFHHPDFIYKFTSAYRETQRCVKILHNVSQTVIRKRREEWAAKKLNGTFDDQQHKKRKFQAFLDILMDLSENDPSLTDEQIRAEVDTVIVGGQETTATTMLIILLMLGTHKEIQDKLYQEMKDIFGDSKRLVEKEDMAKMQYCEAVIHEALRLFPPIPVVMREADSDLVLDDGRTIPAGAICAVNAWGAGRSRRQWGEDALQYRPDRWLEDQGQRHPASFLPFSYGRRSCIGKKYAIPLLKTMISHFVRELEVFSQAQELDFKLDLALRPIKGHLLTVARRESLVKYSS